VDRRAQEGALMRALAAVALLAACHDWAHFRTSPDGAVDLAGVDLAGCPAPGAPPSPGAGCVVYTFAAGVPDTLSAFSAKSDVTVESACQMLHVRVPAGSSHDFWIDDLDAFRIEEKAPRAGPFTLGARIHGALDVNQKFTGVYAADGSSRFVSVQTSEETSGLHDHDVVFSSGSASPEQANFPAATPAAGDSYTYELERMTDLTQFRLTGTQTQTLTVSASAALTPGVVVGNCCGGSAPAFEAWLEWMMVCP
jgi:hypothetical protein